MPSSGRVVAGNALGAQKVMAGRLGIALEVYTAKLAGGEKWCRECQSWHHRSAFGSDRSRYDGLQTTCLTSRVVAKSKPGARERRLKAAVGLAWCRGCAAWLPSVQVAQGACRTHLNKEARRHYAKNPEPTRARKRAARRNLAVVPDWWREERFEEFDDVCAYGCGRPAYALDHVWPVARGGESRPDNLVPACIQCNSSKKDSDPWPWLGRFAAAFPGHYIDFMALNQQFCGPFDPDLEVA